MKNFQKYDIGFFMPPEANISWLRKTYVEKAPKWCSVDLRDGNQALAVPMTIEEKLTFFQMLTAIGFKEIEVGFPAASETEYAFVRKLIEEEYIPDDVSIQVLAPARPEIIAKTFESIKEAKNAIVHFYSATSPVFREEVFGKSKDELLKVVLDSAQCIKSLGESCKGNIRFEYSPEHFTSTEPEYSLEVCNGVLDIWRPTPEKKAIINLPATVSLSMPHVYGMQTAYISENLSFREGVELSLHPHNDRGSAVCDAEMGLLAGGERVEGTLFGNGERTGNVDLITLALNMYSQGVDPNLYLSKLPEIIAIYEETTGMRVHERQPYGGEMVFSAFSGSHQDAIAKCIEKYRTSDSIHWRVPYMPIDPADIGREYEQNVIKINSQSGKGGVGYLLSKSFGYHVPPKMLPAVSKTVKEYSDKMHKGLLPEEVFDVFKKEYINFFEPLDITEAYFNNLPDGLIDVRIIAVLNGGEPKMYSGRGNGHMNAVANALKEHMGYNFHLNFYSEHAIDSKMGTSAKAAAYVGIDCAQRDTIWGVGIHNDIMAASVNALVSAINRMERIKNG